MIQPAEIAKALGTAGTVTEEGVTALLRSVCAEHGGAFYAEPFALHIARGAAFALSGQRPVGAPYYLGVYGLAGGQLLNPENANAETRHVDMIGTGDRENVTKPGKIKYVPAFEELRGLDLVTRAFVPGCTPAKNHRIEHTEETTPTELPAFVFVITTSETTAVARMPDRTMRSIPMQYTLAGGNAGPKTDMRLPMHILELPAPIALGAAVAVVSPHSIGCALPARAIALIANYQAPNFDGVEYIANQIASWFNHELVTAEYPPTRNAEQARSMFANWNAPSPLTLALTKAAEIFPRERELGNTVVDVPAVENAQEFFVTAIPDRSMNETEQNIRALRSRIADTQRTLATLQTRFAAAEATHAQLLAKGKRNFFAEIEQAINDRILVSARLTPRGLVLLLPELTQVRAHTSGGLKAGTYTKPAPMVSISFMDGANQPALDLYSVQVFTHDGFRYPHCHVSYYGAGRACWGYATYQAENVETSLAFERALGNNLSDFIRILLSYLYESTYMAWELNAAYTPPVRKPRRKVGHEVQKITVTNAAGETREIVLNPAPVPSLTEPVLDANGPELDEDDAPF